MINDYPSYIAYNLGLLHEHHYTKEQKIFDIQMPAIRKNENDEWETYASKMYLKQIQAEVKLLDIYKKSIKVSITCLAGTKETLMYFGEHKSPNKCYGEFHMKLEKEVFKLFRESDMLDKLFKDCHPLKKSNEQ